MLKDLKLAYKIGGAFILIVILIMVSGLFTLRNAASLNESFDLIEHAAMPSLLQTSEIKLSVSNLRRFEAQVMIADLKERDSLSSRAIAEREKSYRNYLKIYLS